MGIPRGAPLCFGVLIGGRGLGLVARIGMLSARDYTQAWQHHVPRGTGRLHGAIRPVSAHWCTGLEGGLDLNAWGWLS